MKPDFHALWSTLVIGSGPRRALADVLRQIPVFEGLNPFELRFVIRILHERHYASGELVFREGEAGNGMYIIQQGAVRITGHSETGEEVLYARLRDTQFFGELALVDGEPRSATVTAEEDSVLFGFFKPDLLDLLAKQPALGNKILMNLTGVLSSRLRDTNRKLIEERTRERR